MKKILALALTLVMIFALAVPAASAANDGSVYWLNFKPELDETAQALAAKYTEATGVEVKVVTAASGTYSQTLTSEMDKKAAPTLFIIGNQAGVKEWGEFAMDLTDTPIANELNTSATAMSATASSSTPTSSRRPATAWTKSRTLKA